MCPRLPPRSPFQSVLAGGATQESLTIIRDQVSGVMIRSGGRDTGRSFPGRSPSRPQRRLADMPADRALEWLLYQEHRTRRCNLTNQISAAGKKLWPLRQWGNSNCFQHSLTQSVSITPYLASVNYSCTVPQAQPQSRLCPGWCLLRSLVAHEGLR